MRASASAFVLALVAAAWLVAGPLRQTFACDGVDGACCCEAPAETPDEHGCCGDERPPAEHPAPEPCDCHVEPVPSEPPHTPFSLPDLPPGEPAPRTAGASHPPTAAPPRRLLGICRPPGPPGPSRHVALCVFLI